MVNLTVDEDETVMEDLSCNNIQIQPNLKAEFSVIYLNVVDNKNNPPRDPILNDFVVSPEIAPHPR